jgi:adenylate cyclase
MFVLDTDRRELRRGTALVSLEPQVFDLLEYLVRNRDRVVTKDELLDSVWNGRIVSESTLSTRINAARSAIGDNGETQRLIKTLQRKGLRFIGEVREAGADGQSGTVSSPLDGRGPAAAMPAAESPATLALPDKPSIAVLPFTNMSGDPEQDYFADGMVEEVITALARFPSLFVIARNSSFTYKGRSVDIKQVGRELGVRYVLEGSVRKAGNRVRMTGQLIQAETGMHVWAERYERDLGDIFALQDEMTTSIVGALVPSIQKAEIERVRHKPPESLDAYDLYLRGLAAYFTWTKESHFRALELAEQALQIDPNLVSAMLLAGNCWALRIGNGWWSPLEEALMRLTHYARLAVQVDPDNAEALAILARRTPAITRDHQEAIVLARRAAAVNPNSAYAWRNTGHALVTCGVPEEAVIHLERALRLDPRDPNGHDTVHGMGLALIQLGRDAEAVTFARRAVQQNPKIAPSWRTLASALALSGQIDEARAALRQMLALDPNCTVQTMARRVGYTEKTGARIFEGWRKAGMPE